ncbi:hypothetical protein FOL47_008089 [Perkinsus chesapeaki]|uniref:Uncharacterized protein n=1 Tax=Perkinsus chesapeaki TaxID=330153 RepID=A0A7J6MVP5_PERCH|nr:hypothetical protein FOL47_008089 [Perkinsus chesapeaki]
MYGIIGMISLVCILGTSGELRVQDIVNGSRYNPVWFRAPQGSCYEKPIGKCVYNKDAHELEGCQCAAPALVAYALTDDDDVDVVVCTVQCGGNPCPNAPKGTGSCNAVGSLSLCMINCKDDKDCPETAVCYNWGGPSSSCLYRP